MTEVHEGVQHRTTLHIDKFSPEQVEWVRGQSGIIEPKLADFNKWLVDPDEITDVEDNLLTTAGLGRLTSFLIGTGSLVGFTATTTRIGVGDGSTAAAVTDTDLSAVAGSTHRWYQVVDSAPTRVTTAVTNDSIQAIATYASADGNFAQTEWALNLGTATVASSNAVDASAGACLFNRKVAALGTKVSGAVWAFTAKIQWA